MLNRCLVLLLALARVFVHAHHPVLRFEGLGAEAYNCPDDNIKKIKSNIDRAVNAAAIAHDVIDPDSDLYLHEGPGRRQRQLGESDSSYSVSSYNLCARNGCPSNHRWQYCWIIVRQFLFRGKCLFADNNMSDILANIHVSF